MEKLIQYTKTHFKPSNQYVPIHNIDIDKMVDEAQEWMLNIVSFNDFPSDGINLDLFRKEMTDWYMLNIGYFYPQYNSFF